MAVEIIKKSVFVTLANKDREIRRLHRLRESGVYAIDLTANIRELEVMHGTRQLRGYELKDVLQNTQRRIISATLQDTAFRSRAVEIRMRCFKILRLLEEHIEDISRYLITEYAGQLKQEFSTAKARDEAIKYVIKEFTGLRKKLQTVIDLAAMVIDDLDKSDFRIDKIIRIVEISFARKRNI